VRILLIFLAAAGGLATQEVTWGGEHVEIKVASRGAIVELDCAHGTIDERIAADAQGAFTLKGTFTPESHGPTRDDAPAAAKATYSGTIKGNRMTLHVTIEGEEGPGRDFTLTRDRPGTLYKCR